MSVPANVIEASGMESLEARAERYLQEAERVRADAETTRNPETRSVLLDIARQYETAATMVEELRRYR
jgi:hypothetical protein